jgi:hypothetical protein
MKRTPYAPISALLCILIAVLLTALIRVSPANADQCGGDSGTTLQGGTGPGSVGVSGVCGVTPTDLPGNAGSAVLVIDCGYATATDDHRHWNRACGPTGFACPPIPGSPNPHQFITVVSLDDTAVPIAAWCAGVSSPMPSTAALRDEVIRLLHPPAVGVSPSTGTALINLRTLFWVHTATRVDLGRASLVGFPVSLRISYDRAEFDFGDGTSATLTGTPGTAYHPAQDCGRCTDRFGHDYTTRGTVTVTARVYWHAQFRIGTGAWTDIPGQVTATQPSRTTLTIKQSRATLTAPR